MDRKKEPHDAAQKKWIIFKYFNALKYKENHTLQLAEESLRISEESLHISKESAKYGKFAAWLAGIGIFTTIIIAILSFIFS